MRIWRSQQEIQSPQFCDVKNEVIVGERTWIRSNVIILPGVSIVEGDIIVASAFVTWNAQPYSVMTGVPTRKKDERTSELQYQFTGRHDSFV